jgi:hypothetical protein
VNNLSFLLGLPVKLAITFVLARSFKAGAAFVGQEKWRSLVAVSFEVVFHQLLYNRHFYPGDTLGSFGFLGLRFRVNSHPGAVSYIQDFGKVAGPLVLSRDPSEVQLRR